MRNIGFIGAGQMATALATGIAQSDPHQFTLFVSDPNPEALTRFVDSVGDAAEVHTSASNQETVEQAEAVWIAVKPQWVRDALDEVSFESDPLVISIVAGLDLVSLQRLTGSQRLIRVMPNTPSLIGRGASGFAAGPNATPQDQDWVQQALESIGITVRVPSELIDGVTGLSGSGPAYVFTFIEALIDGGVLVGLPRADARKLALQTVLGAAELVAQTELHPAVLRDQVTSPGGTTIAALKALEESGFRDAVMSAVQAASDRAAELG